MHIEEKVICMGQDSGHYDGSVNTARVVQTSGDVRKVSLLDITGSRNAEVVRRLNGVAPRISTSASELLSTK